MSDHDTPADELVAALVEPVRQQHMNALAAIIEQWSIDAAAAGLYDTPEQAIAALARNLTADVEPYRVSAEYDSVDS